MKKIMAMLTISSMLCGEGLYIKKEIIPEIDLTKKLVLKTTTSDYIKSVDISKNKFLVSDSNEIKLFNLNEKELIKKIPSKNIKKVKISTDETKIIALTDKAIFILNNTDYNIITTIKGDFYYFKEYKNILAIQESNKIKLFNLQTGKKLGEISQYATNASISPNLKKIALSYRNSIYIYNLKDKTLLNTIDVDNGIVSTEWADNNSLFTLEKKGYREYDINKYDIITSNKLNELDKYREIDLIKVLDKNNVLVFNNSLAYIYDFSKNKITKKFDLSQNSDIASISLRDGYLAVGYSNNSYIYKTDLSKLPKNNQITKNSITNSKTIKNELKKETTKTIEKPVVVEKIIEKKVYVKEHKNIKPTVDIFASQTEGIAPLKVNFKIIANDEDGKIVSYYINLAGKEAIGKGNPKKSFSYTFTHPGKYKIMVAVKDNKNAIATKKIVINVREETFEDYKKGLMGN